MEKKSVIPLNQIEEEDEEEKGGGGISGIANRVFVFSNAVIASPLIRFISNLPMMRMSKTSFFFLF